MPCGRHEQLAVENKSRSFDSGEGGDDLGKIARQRLAGLGPQLHPPVRLESQATKAIPFWLELPAAVLRQFGDETSFHRTERSGYQAHRLPFCSASNWPAPRGISRACTTRRDGTCSSLAFEVAQGRE